MHKPKYYAYVTQEIEQNGEKKTFWTKIGAAFENRSNGFNVTLIPGISVSGKIVLLEPKEKEETGTPLDWKD